MIQMKYQTFYLLLLVTIIISATIRATYMYNGYNKNYQIFGIITQNNESKYKSIIEVNDVEFLFFGLSDQQKQNIQKGDSIYKPMGEKYFMLFGKDANGVYHVKDTIPFW